MNSTNDLCYYEVSLLWNSATRGTLSSPVIPDKIRVETSPVSQKGKKERWTPEHLFIAALSSSLMSAFLLVADNSKFEFISFESNAIGKIEKVDGKVAVTEIILKPKLTIPATQKETRAKRAIEMSEKTMAIANSVKTRIFIEPYITIQ
jgi:organic hydroperoxide reductase OsmC/OhrA